MGMYIIGKEPDRCGVCPCFHAETPMYCQAVIADVQKPRIVRPYAKGLPEWCPLIEIPKHGRLIDADALVRELNSVLVSFGSANGLVEGGLSIAVSTVNGKPTIIPAEEGE